MAYKGKFNHQRNGNADLNFNEETTSFADLDLGLDIDLSFLDEPVKRPEAAPAIPVEEAPKSEKKADKKSEKAALKASRSNFLCSCLS